MKRTCAKRTCARLLSRVVSEQNIGVEAGTVARVAGAANLVDPQQHSVAVAVQPHGMDVLGVARRRALDPLLATGPRRKVRLSLRKSVPFAMEGILSIPPPLPCW